jgi:hypothetical protein
MDVWTLGELAQMTIEIRLIRRRRLTASAPSEREIEQRIVQMKKRMYWNNKNKMEENQLRRLTTMTTRQLYSV